MSNRDDIKAAISNLKVHEAFKLKNGNDLRLEQTKIKSSSDHFDLSAFIPTHKQFDFCEKSDGVFQIPHRIFEFIHKVINSKVELLVFNCLLRYTLGFQRTRCEASQTFIAKWTGIAAPNVRRALRQLIEQEHIKRIESGSVQHESAVYELPIVVAYLEFLSAKKSKININQDHSDLRLNTPPISAQNEPQSEIKLIPKKDIIKINKHTTHSQQSKGPDWPEWINEYLQSIHAPRKRQSERQYAQEMLAGTPPDRLLCAFEFLLRNGDLISKSPVHSPMAYLATCLDEVLKRAEKKMHPALAKAPIVQPEVEFSKMEAAFIEFFPESELQNQMVEVICKKQNAWIVKGSISRKVAIQFWWDDLPKEKQEHYLQGGRK